MAVTELVGKLLKRAVLLFSEYFRHTLVCKNSVMCLILLIKTETRAFVGLVKALVLLSHCRARNGEGKCNLKISSTALRDSRVTPSRERFPMHTYAGEKRREESEPLLW